MHQYLLPPLMESQSELNIEGDDFHYLTRVLRMNSGDEVPARTAGGQLYRARMESVEKKRCTLHLIAVAEDPLPRQAEITLFQGLPKGKKMDTIVRQATEAGVSRIVPVIMEHCVAEIGKGTDAEKKRERWERIIKEAFQQCAGRNLPRLLKPTFFAQIPSLLENGIGLFCHEQPLVGHSPKEVLKDWNSKPIGIMIGPEGGLSPNEVQLLSALANWSPLHFGPTILRTETAALYGVAAIKTLLQEIQP